MTNEELKKYIKTMLGESYVDVELSDEDIKVIVKQTLDKVAPYYDGRRFILGQGKVIDLSDHPGIKEIINVYDTRQVNIFTLQDYVFGGNGIMIYSSNLIDKLETYVCYQMMYNEFNRLKGINFRYIKPNLYVTGYESEQVLIEAVVRPMALSDIEEQSEYYSWVKDYALALAKELVGRTRTKFSVDGSPYQLDGDRLLSEAQTSKSELESKLIGSLFVV